MKNIIVTLSLLTTFNAFAECSAQPYLVCHSYEGNLNSRSLEAIQEQGDGSFKVKLNSVIYYEDKFDYAMASAAEINGRIVEAVMTKYNGGEFFQEFCKINKNNPKAQVQNLLASEELYHLISKVSRQGIFVSAFAEFSFSCQ